METQTDYYIQLLEGEYIKRKRFNKQYSKRAFAQFLEINSGTLNAIMKGDRKIPISSLKTIITKLELTPSKAEKLIRSQDLKGQRLKKVKAEIDEKFSKKLIDDSSDNNYHILAHWEHYALLSLIETDEFQSSPDWMAQRLGVDTKIITASLDRLMAEELIQQDKNDEYVCTYNRIDTPKGIVSKALQEAHIEELELAKEKLHETDVHLRHFASETMTINPENMDKAHELINKFREEMKELMTTEKKKEVYLLSVQYFPLTKLENNNQEITK